MSDFIVALYPDHATAARARTELVADGFPTDRVEVTSRQEPGQAGVGPEKTLEANLADYYGNLFEDGAQGASTARLTEAVLEGRSTLTVHPRGTVEIEQAGEILERHGPLEVRRHIEPDESRDGLLGERAAGPPR